MHGATVSSIRMVSGFGLPHAVLIVIALLCLCGMVVALVFLDGLFRDLTLSTATGAGAATVAMMVWTGLRRAQARLQARAAMALMTHDQMPCFITDETGRLVAQNDAALTRFGPQQGHALARALSGVSPTIPLALQRLEMALAHAPHAQEELAIRKGVAVLRGHRIGSGVFWRLEQAERHLEVAEPIEPVAAPIQAQAAPVSEGAPSDPLAFSAASFERLPVALLHIAPDGAILASNSLAQSLLGLKSDEVIPLGGLVEGLGRPMRDWIGDVMQGRIPNRAEFVRAGRRDGDQFLQISLEPIRDQSGPSLIAVLHDATELKMLEQQFAQSQKMQAIGELAGGVAHDFNNLLTAITGHCDLLLLRHDEGDQNYGDLVQISQNANRAAALVGQLLAFSRKQTLQLEAVDLRESMGELTHLLNRLVGEKIRLKLSHDADLSPIRADRRQFDQAIMNLVVNARDAMPEGGDIHVTTRMEHLEDPLERDHAHVPAGRFVTITVRDDGVGILQDRLSRIFEPFFTTKRTGEGTGLGLSMVYGIVKQMGGFVFVDSELGQGASFKVYCPVYDASVAMQDAPPEEAPSDHAEISMDDPTARPLPARSSAPSSGVQVILLVEDEAPVRAFASRALRLRGYQVLEADSAEAALETLRDSDVAVDLFVTDVVMPGMDGPTWVREALKSRPEVKVVFVSGYAEDAFEKNSEAIPNSVFLPKPFSLSELTQTVQRQLH